MSGADSLLTNYQYKPQQLKMEPSFDFSHLPTMRNSQNENNAPVKPKKKRGPNLNRPRTAPMVRRNSRERNRVQYLNSTFEVLRQHLPGKQSKSKSKKLSKVDTLREACQYIQVSYFKL